MAEDELQKNQPRFTFSLDEKLEQNMRDTALIMGIKPGVLVTKALTKYIEAIEKSAGGEFQKAKEAIEAVRALG